MTSPRAWALLLLLVWPFQTFDDAVRAWVQVQRTPTWSAAMQVVSDRSRGVGSAARRSA
jgi:hypothetical protein